MISNRSLAVIFCPIHTSQQEQLVHVCLESTCKNQPLICHLCLQSEAHKNHPTMSIAKFNSTISNLKYDSSVLSFSSKLKELAAGSLGIIRSFREKILGQLDKLEATVGNYFEKKQVKLSQLMGEAQTDAQINWNQSFERVVQEVNQQRKLYFDHKHTQTLIKADRFETIVKCKAQQLNNYITQTYQSLSKCIALFQKEDQTININYAWSNTLKNPDFQIYSNVAKRITMHSRTDSCCLGDWEMSGKSKQNYRWSVNLSPLANYVGIGICQENLTRQNGFQYWGGWENKGHGNYIIYYSQVMYNSCVGGSSNSSFGFTAGDTINLEYNPMESKLTFIKGDEKQQMNVQKGFSYRAVAYFSPVNSQIKLGIW